MWPRGDRRVSVWAPTLRPVLRVQMRAPCVCPCVCADASAVNTGVWKRLCFAVPLSLCVCLGPSAHPWSAHVWGHSRSQLFPARGDPG